MLKFLRPSLPPAGTPKPTFRKDYRAPDYGVDRVDLLVKIDSQATEISSRLEIKRNPKTKGQPNLRLDGEELELLEIKLDGKILSPKDYTLNAESLMLKRPPKQFVLEIRNRIYPDKNSALSGFYRSGPMLTTQCESEGFRRITWFLDRPDVLARFHVRLEADRTAYPILLANGNLVNSGKLAGGKHWAEWDDPFPKPCYLFAMVAGDLKRVKDHFTTRSGRDVLLEMYVEDGNQDQTGIALKALKDAMRWDEEAYGLEYDLDRFMIVATSFFNMGAMENKGLNIFNADCVLARPETATDADIAFVERVVGHEYFHNWTGNRITCRDWFQLSLKEGLTVFREQQFCEAMNSPHVERIRETRSLRASQFAEDAGPQAHPVRPESYVTIDNFYTATVYSKGAELCRMLHTILGERRWRRGMELYVKRHDGSAATCDDFIAAMADANRVDLSHFMLWYSQAGTPVVKVRGVYNAKAKTYDLTLSQSCPPTPKQKRKVPLHIPFAFGLLDSNGHELVGTEIVQLRTAKQSVQLKNIPEAPIPSLLRHFSAPVRVDYDYSERDLLLLLAHDHDSFARWDAGQTLYNKTLLRLVSAAKAGRKLAPPKALLQAMAPIIQDEALDPAYAALMLQIPGEQEIAQLMANNGQKVEVVAIHKAREFLRQAIGKTHHEAFARRWRALKPDPYAANGVAMGQRSLRNLCLAYLVAGGEHAALQEAAAQVRQSPNMTDQMTALSILVQSGDKLAQTALNHFYAHWHDDELIINKWLAVQAAAARPDTLARIKSLLKHPDFDLRNPNKVRALLGSFAHGNPVAFHKADAAGYRLLAQQVLKLDRLNPQMAARLAQAFDRWRIYPSAQQRQMRAALRTIQAAKNLSPNLYEIVNQALAG
jgi:aminopeptidase N